MSLALLDKNQRSHHIDMFISKEVASLSHSIAVILMYYVNWNVQKYTEISKSDIPNSINLGYKTYDKD